MRKAYIINFLFNLLLTGLNLVFPLNIGASGCAVYVAENPSNLYDSTVEKGVSRLENYYGIDVKRAEAVWKLESIVYEAIQEGCDCISDLYIMGHSVEGGISIGCSWPCSEEQYIGINNEYVWKQTFERIKQYLCEETLLSQGIYLYGCGVGACDDASKLLHEIAKITGMRVFAPTDGLVASSKMLEYKGGWQVGDPTEENPRKCIKARDVIASLRERDSASNSYQCPCNGITYQDLTECINNCSVTLGCFSNICTQVSNRAYLDKYSGNPVLTGGTGTAMPSAFLATSCDQKRISGNLGSLNESLIGKSASKSTLEALAGWDDYGLSQPAILKDAPMYRMWFAGYDSSDTARIGYATSTDGINWTKYSGNPVLQEGASGSWDETQVYNPTVIRDGSTFKMWFTGYSTSAKHARIGYATSPNGITWTKHPTYVLDVGASGAWDEDGVGECCVIKDGGTYKMWFGGSDYYQWWRTGYATSTDGIVWTKYSGNPVLSEGEWGNWDEWGASAPAVIKDGSTYHMLYGGIDAYNVSRIGYATSSDGKNWTKSTRDPLITGGLGSAWDNGNVFHATWFKDSNEELFKVFYRGYSADTNAYALGFAATTIVSTSPVFPVSMPWIPLLLLDD